MSPVPSPSVRLGLATVGAAIGLAVAAGPAHANAWGSDLTAVEPSTGQAAAGEPFTVVVRGRARPAEPAPAGSLAVPGPGDAATEVLVDAIPADATCGGRTRYNAARTGTGAASPVAPATLEAGVAVPVTVGVAGDVRLCTYAGPVGWSTMATLSPVQPTLRVVAPDAPAPPTVPAGPVGERSCRITPRAVSRGRIVVRCTNVTGRVDLRVRRAGRTHHVWRTLTGGRLHATPSRLGLRRGLTRVSVFQDGRRLGVAMIRRR